MMFRRCLIVLSLLVICVGCANKRKAVSKKPPKPWIGTRSMCIFPMSHAPSPGDPGAIADAMTEGWKARLEVPEGRSLVHIEGAEHYPAFEAMHIDLSDVVVRYENDRKQKLRPYGQPHGSLRVENFEFVAAPLLLGEAKLLLDMSVTDARLDVRRDRRGRPMLTLVDARDGTLRLEVAKEDIDTLLLFAARKMAGNLGVSIDRTDLKLQVVESRVIKMDLKLNTRLGFLPAGLRFKARIDIDDRLDGTITRLNCEGDQLLGPLISAVVNPVLAKYEGQKKPLVGFEWGDMKLRDVTMASDESFRLEAKFGSDGPTKGKARPTRVASRR